MSISNKIVVVFFLVFSFNISRLSFSQNKLIDSLNVLVKNDKTDSAKVDHLNSLAWQYLMIGNADSAIDLANRVLQITSSFQKSEQAKVCVHTYGYLGMAFSDKGNFSTSLTNFFKALNIAEELNDKKTIASNSGNIGSVYGRIGEFDKALEYFFKALKIGEETKNKKTIANNLGNIGNIYDYKNDFPKALEYYFKALELQKELNSKSGIGANLGNIGLVYQNMGEFEKAITYYFQALTLSKQRGDQRGITIWNGNIGSLYLEMMKSASPSEKTSLSKRAESHFIESLAIDTTIGFLHHLENTYHSLSDLYSITGDHKKSLNYFKLYSNTKDSLFNEEKNKEITRHEMTYEFEKKEATLKAEQEKKEAVAEADKKRQNIFFWLISIVAIAIAIIAIIVFRSLRLTRQQKQIIEHQKELVEEKQLEILDSIHYAKRIQQSLLPTEKYIDKNLNRLNE